MKKNIFLLASVFMILILSSCSQPKQAMDELSEEGKYLYKNKDLGFALDLPDTFTYYQVQRKQTDEYVEIEFFVPTADRSFPQEVQSYAVPITLRVYEDNIWQDLEKKDYINDVFDLVKEVEDKKYFIKFWRAQPKDWEDKWSETEEEKIKTSFKTI